MTKIDAVIGGPTLSQLPIDRAGETARVPADLPLSREGPDASTAAEVPAVPTTQPEAKSL